MMLECQTATDKPEERLNELLSYHYGLVLRKVSPAPRGWLLETNRGVFTLSRVEKMDATYWSMVDHLLNHMRERGLTQLPRLIRTQQGRLAFNGFYSRYLLWDNLQGKRCNWSQPETWAAVGKALAYIHKASRDFIPEEAYGRFTAAGKWSTLWNRNLKLMDTIGKACDLSANPRSVDRLWLNIHTYATTLIETALHYLEQLGGDETVWGYTKNGIVSQHYLNRHSWGTNASGVYTLIDWDHTVLDVRVRDLAQMIHLAYGDKKTFSERVRLLLENYQSIHPLQEAEWPFLYVRLLFPEQLVKTARNVYEKHTISEDDAARVLERVIEDQHRREYHLRYIPRLLKDMAHISIPEVDWLK